MPQSFFAALPPSALRAVSDDVTFREVDVTVSDLNRSQLGGDLKQMSHPVAVQYRMGGVTHANSTVKYLDVRPKRVINSSITESSYLSPIPL